MEYEHDTRRASKVEMMTELTYNSVAICEWPSFGQVLAALEWETGATEAAAAAAAMVGEKSATICGPALSKQERDDKENISPQRKMAMKCVTAELSRKVPLLSDGSANEPPLQVQEASRNDPDLMLEMVTANPRRVRRRDVATKDAITRLGKQ